MGLCYSLCVSPLLGYKGESLGFHTTFGRDVTLKLGFFVTNQYLPGESMPEKIQESAEQVGAARAAGFDLICTGQHYLAAP